MVQAPVPAEGAERKDGVAENNTAHGVLYRTIDRAELSFQLACLYVAALSSEQLFRQASTIAQERSLRLLS